MYNEVILVCSLQSINKDVQVVLKIFNFYVPITIIQEVSNLNIKNKMVSQELMLLDQRAYIVLEA